MRQPIPFGKYVLLERICVGGMAEVFKAKSFGVEGFEKILAIKRILPSMAEDADFIDMFIDEAKICGQLNHANICQIFELGRVDDSHFIAMEYVWGKDLLQIQNRFRKLRQTMKPEMAAFIAAKLCEGLDYAHKKKDAAGKPLGIIHRDISPQNILVSYEGELKIIDFGIAKAAVALVEDAGRRAQGQVRLHVARAGARAAARPPLRRVRHRHHPLRAADRRSPVRGRERLRDARAGAQRRRAAGDVNQHERAGRAREDHHQGARASDVEDRYQWANEMQESLQAFLLTREPVFTAKHLSPWMREQFALEMKREQEILDEQRKIGKELLSSGRASAATAQPKNGSGAGGDDFGGSTNVLEGHELADLVLAAELSGDTLDDDDGAEKTTVSPGYGAPPPSPSSAPLPEQSTQILADALIAKTSPPKSSNAAGVTQSRDAVPAELPAQPTVILEGGTGSPSCRAGMLYSNPMAATVSAMQAVPPPTVGAARPTMTPRRRR